ncbi:TetR/AcrR family transcriptional regulator [Lacticaseibacillus kribbianus]|uniref:TetR/AcrR family transcriptional regulator n=1 Tax=Lacticaseibacillus kribbianus TaxID=2926292 RepID=UPI001CD1FE76|nr:TetR/AcrR family transcriptional regulator [Lacticaseibacillus kribbianus]
MSVNDVTTLFDQSLEAGDLTAKQKAVLRASLELFAAQGFSRTSTGDIAKAAGVSEGTVYKRFKTKEDILQAILAPFFQQVIPRVAGEFVDQALTALPPDVATFLTAVLTDRLTFAVRNYQVVKVVVAEALQRPQLVAQVKATFEQAVVQRLLPAIAHYQQAGQLVDWPPLQIVRYVVGTMAGDLLPQLITGQPVDVAAIVPREVTFLLRGLRPDPQA